MWPPRDPGRFGPMGHRRTFVTRGFWGRLLAIFGGSAAIALACHFWLGSDWFEVAGFVTGVVAVYLVAIEHIWNWPIGIVNVLIYAYVFWNVRLYADMTLQIVFFVLAVHGWWSWLRGGTGGSKLEISRLTAVGWTIAGAIVVVGTAVYKPIIEHYKGASPFWDTLLTVMSLVAQVLLNRKVLENWWFWIAIDLAYVPLYLSRKLYPTTFLYMIFLALAVQGWMNWSRTLRRAEDPLP